MSNLVTMLRVCGGAVMVVMVVAAAATLFFLYCQSHRCCPPQLSGPYKAEDPSVLEALRTHYLRPPSSQPYNLSPHSLVLEGPHNSSWGWVYTRLREVLEDEKGGFFVDAGALNGEFMSHTLWLERELVWTGLLIEPDKASYQALLSKNRKAWSSNTCLSLVPYPRRIVFVSETGAKEQRMWNWVYRGMSHEYHPSQERQHYLLKSYSVVQCFPLLSYLLTLNTSRVDLLALDTQGHEAEVLAHLLDHPAITVRVILVQDRERKVNVNAIKESGYVLLDSDINHIFIKSKDRLLQRGAVQRRLTNLQ